MGNDQAITVEGSFSETISRINEAERARHPNNIHSSTIYNSQDLEAAWMSTHREVDKEDVVRTHSGLLLCHTKEWNRAIGGSNMVVQNEVSQKEKRKYHTLMHICGI